MSLKKNWVVIVLVLIVILIISGLKKLTPVVKTPLEQNNDSAIGTQDGEHLGVVPPRPRVPVIDVWPGIDKLDTGAGGFTELTAPGGKGDPWYAEGYTVSTIKTF